MMRVVKTNCSFAEYKRGAGNTPLGNFVLCKTNEEIKQPTFLKFFTNELKNVLGDNQALIKNIFV